MRRLMLIVWMCFVEIPMTLGYIATFTGIPQMVTHYEKQQIITLIEQREEAMKWGLLPEQIQERREKEKEYEKYTGYIRERRNK